MTGACRLASGTAQADASLGIVGEALCIEEIIGFPMRELLLLPNGEGLVSRLNVMDVLPT
jgi:hypothetical protein